MSLQLPLFNPTDSDWCPPTTFPRLSGIVGLDVETYDPNLLSRGPGGVRGDGYLVGISVANGDFVGYYPISHLGPGNLGKDIVCTWLRRELGRPDLTVVGANILYDVEWLSTEGIEVKGRLIDVCMLDALIEEEANESMSLNALCQRHLGKTKNEDLLREAANVYGVDPKSGLWSLPPKYVGEYAEWDALAPILIYEKQQIELAKQGLMDIAELEIKLTPLLWKMRRRGVRVDLEAGKLVQAQLTHDENGTLRCIEQQIGWRPDIWSAKSLAKVFDQLGEGYQTTKKGAPSFTKDFLSHHQNEVIKAISDAREINRLRTVFVEDWISKYTVNGRAYPEWRQLASDDGGTRTGRMASANPNMQQIPSRAEIAAMIRALFIADEGSLWGKLDYSQQEPRLLVHFASVMQSRGTNMPGAYDVRDAYRNDPKMDIYAMLATMGNISRRHAKGATLGRMYGMGAKKYAEQQGVSISEGERILAEFDQRVPFVRILADRLATLADTRGWIRTLGGRRRHFNLWEPRYSEQETIPLPLEKAQKAYEGPLRRYGTRKALNALIQGSAADMTKRAMVRVHDELGVVPTLAVHDEIDACVDGIETLNKIKEVAETAYDLQVPIVADCKLGEHWS